MPFRPPAAVALLALAACATPAAPPPAPEAVDPALTALIAEKDAAMFAAFNSCDGETFGAYLEDGLEFYHDQAGLSVGRAATVEAVNNNVCNNFTRQLVPGTLEVWPIPGYGAVETGLHTFTNVGATAPHGIARFLHVWHEDAGAWRIARIVSYDHGPYPREAPAE
ncbi:MAG: nuclear transport factor 2 family protein [Hyphomonas sp.]|uniref:nuclear transport factor 2 family protein n=1 Tax=Hyphomonas sp. TaxID=87 RepID=UPI00179A3DEB|nr:nuclear transport factor 2 family protein [Hyphomonas sp.]MBA3070379.1 nuclear transport factor 2 family protein [Hyphomonas sp.]MBU3921911.1 nuclear transport factor 2 family protein [Alphaproteobacteria bacterium]MBU4062866.1 nuclear transport factor 2 family protein [Alphaproteobacteria bacterium]MBU4163785.1 nuclear transport factor 2 family protein [Alphaproteobacteria bacterium]